MAGFENDVMYAIGDRLEPSTAQAIAIMQNGSSDVSRINTIGSPEGVVAANPSSLDHDPSTGQVYIKRSGVGNTGWLPISTNSQDLHTAKFIVSATGTVGTGANYSTIADAIFDASSGDTIFIMPGTYTENLTITKSLTFFAYTASLRMGDQNVIITGKITIATASVSNNFYGIRFNTNGAVSFSLTANSSRVTCQDCYFNATNANSILVTGNGGTDFYIENCSGNLASTFTLFTINGGQFWLKNCIFNDVTTPGTSTVTNSDIFVFNCYLLFPLSSSATSEIEAVNSIFGSIQSPFANTTWITTAGTGSHLLDRCTINSGTASAISIGAGTTLMANDLVVQSTNTNAITGAGTIQYGNITFTGSSSTINTTTQTPFVTRVGTLTAGTPNTGVTNVLTLTNPSNTASSQAQVNVTVGGTSSGDAYTTYTVAGTTNWSEGIDNSVSGDPYVISASNALGTTNVLSMTTAGAASFVLGNVDVTKSASGVDVSLTASNTSNTGSSTATQYLTVAGTSAGDARVQYAVSGTTTWTEGVDNSDSDAYVLAASTALGTTNVIRAATAGQITYPLQPIFAAYTAGLTNVTGDGTNYAIIWELTTLNVGSSYSTSTGKFTAPVSGNYLFNATVNLSAVTVAATQVIILYASDEAVFPAARILQCAGTMADNTNGLAGAGSMILKMTAGKFVTINALVSGTTKTIGVPGGTELTFRPLYRSVLSGRRIAESFSGSLPIVDQNPAGSWLTSPSIPPTIFNMSF